jgi:hypothetical protein
MAALTTLATVKSWLSITGTAADTLLSGLITRTSAAAESRMDRVIARARYNVVRNGNGKQAMMSPELPIVSVDSVTVDGVTIPARVGTSGSGYAFDEQLIYLNGYCFTKGVQNVALALRAGFATTPLDLEQAVLDIVAFKYRGREWIGQGSKILNGETVTFLRDAPPDALRTIDSYRRVTSS